MPKFQIGMALEELEAEMSNWELKFPRRYGAERKRLPYMRAIFEECWTSLGKPPTQAEFAEAVWDACELDPEFELDVHARARRAHPSLAREYHLYLMLVERFSEVAEVQHSANLDIQHKTDFVIKPFDNSFLIRVHSRVRSKRSNMFADMNKKTPLAVGDGNEHDIVLSINKDNCRLLGNKFWVYTDSEVDRVFNLFNLAKHTEEES